MPDTPKQDTPSKELGCFGKVCIGIALLVAVAVVLALWCYHAWQERLTAENKAMLAQLRAEGYPTTLEEMNSSRRIPPGSNGAALWEEAFRLFPHESTIPQKLPLLGEGKRPDIDKTLSAEQLILIKDFLGKQEKLFAAIHRAAAQDAPCHFLVRIDDPMSSLPYATQTRDACKILQLQIMLTLSTSPSHAPDTLLQHLHSMGKVIQSLENEYGVAGPRVRFYHERSLQTVFQRLACQSPVLWISSINRMKFDRYIRDTSATKRSFAEHLSICMAQFRQLENGDLRLFDSTALSQMETYCFQYVGLQSQLPDDKNFYLKQMKEYMSLCDQPTPVRLQKAKKLHLELYSAIGWRGLKPVSIRVLDNLLFFWEEATKTLAAWRTLHTAMAVERYRQEKGALPATLAELLPAFLDAVPLDPFDGKPLRYTITTPGFVVYSVGENLTDDGGKDATFPKTISHEPDIIFVVPH